MPQAQILINTIPGSNDDMPIDTLVQLDNQNIGGETGYLWSIVDQPPGPADTLSLTNIQNPTFTPKKEGSYLIQVAVNPGPTQLVDRQVIGIRQFKTRERVPAAQEEGQTGPRGWAGAAGSLLQRVDNMYSEQFGVFTATCSGGGLTFGTPVYPSSVIQKKTGLPGEENFPGFAPTSLGAGLTTDLGYDIPIGLFISQPDGTPTAGPGDLILVKHFGFFQGLTTGIAAQPPGTTLYLTGAGAISNIPPTVGAPRRCGYILGGNDPYNIWFDGTGKANPPTMLSFGNVSIPIGAGAYYMDPWWSRNMAQANIIDIRIPFPGIIAGMFVTSTAGPNGGPVTMTLWKNNVITALAVVLPNFTPTSEVFISTPVVTVNTGDALSMVVSHAGLIAWPDNLVVTMMMMPRGIF